jgi:excisionase family DNA binding protein
VNDARRRALYAVADAVGDLLDLLDRPPTTTEPAQPREPLRLMRVAEVAERLGSSRSSVYELINERRLRAVRFGRSVRIATEELERFIREGYHPAKSWTPAQWNDVARHVPAFLAMLGKREERGPRNRLPSIAAPRRPESVRMTIRTDRQEPSDWAERKRQRS